MWDCGNNIFFKLINPFQKKVLRCQIAIYSYTQTSGIWDIVDGIDYWFVNAGHGQVRGEGTAVNLDEKKAAETPSAGQDADDNPTGIRRSST